MKQKIFSLAILLLGAFFLFFPQTSQAISCKCKIDIGFGFGDDAAAKPSCAAFPTAYNGSEVKNCDEYKATVLSKYNESASIIQNSIDKIQCETFYDETCTAQQPPQTDSGQLFSDVEADLNARKPILEINIPGLNFSDVGSSTDETGTYFYIAWIPELISALYKFLLAIVSIVAAVVIVIQGVRVIGSGGGEGKTTAYKKIFQAIVGLFIAWGSYAILYNINPALVQFNALKVQVVTGVPLESVVGEEDGEGTEVDSADDYTNTGESTAGTNFVFCKEGESKCNDKCLEFFQQPTKCPFNARLSSPLKIGKIRCNYHIVDPKSKQGAEYDINATYNLDLPAPVQTNIYAPIDGTATYKPKNSRCGNSISFTFTENSKTYTLSMCHLWDSVLKKDEKTKVTRGQLLGRTGGACCTGDTNGTKSGCKFDAPLCQDGESTGRSTAPHLHIGNLATGKGKFPILPCIEQ